MIKRSPQELDDIRFKIDSLMEANRKPPITDRSFDVWLETLRDVESETVLDGLSNYSKHFEYAPTPNNLYKLCVRNPRHNQTKPENQFEKPCDPVIAKAWIISMRLFHGWAPKDVNPDVSLTDEQAIEIVNREAIKHQNPDAIPDKYKIKSMWEKADLFNAA